MAFPAICQDEPIFPLCQSQGFCGPPSLVAVPDEISFCPSKSAWWLEAGASPWCCLVDCISRSPLDSPGQQGVAATQLWRYPPTSSHGIFSHDTSPGGWDRAAGSMAGTTARWTPQTSHPHASLELNLSQPLSWMPWYGKKHQLLDPESTKNEPQTLVPQQMQLVLASGYMQHWCLWVARAAGWCCEELSRI